MIEQDSTEFIEDGDVTTKRLRLRTSYRGPPVIPSFDWSQIKQVFYLSQNRSSSVMLFNRTDVVL